MGRSRTDRRIAGFRGGVPWAYGKIPGLLGSHNLGARVSRPAGAACLRWPACYPENDPPPNQAGLETRAPNLLSTTCVRRTRRHGPPAVRGLSIGTKAISPCPPCRSVFP